jgi:hypothetical protein
MRFKSSKVWRVEHERSMWWPHVSPEEGFAFPCGDDMRHYGTLCDYVGVKQYLTIIGEFTMIFSGWDNYDYI